MIAQAHETAGGAPNSGALPSPANRIRVLHFIANSQPLEYFRLLVRFTDWSRFDVYVGSLDRSGRLQEGLHELGVRTLALGAVRRTQYLAATLRLAWWLRHNQIDVVQVHLLEASLVGLTAARLAGVPLTIFTGHHSHEVPLHKRRLLLEVDRLAARPLCDHVIAPSMEMKETFTRVYGCSRDKVEVIYHGLDLERLNPVIADGSRFRAEYGLEGRLVLGAISRYFWVKNLEALVRAFAMIASEVPNAMLVIVGGGGDPTGLASLVRSLDLSDRVLLLPPRTDIADVLAAFDLFVHPALAESFGLAVLEAMAMARPVVTTPVGIAREVVEDRVSGLVARGKDPESLRRAIAEMLAARERWPEIGTEARRRALAFTPEKWVWTHEQRYTDWLEASSRRNRRLPHLRP